MITKTYPINTIDITEIIDSILNQNLSFAIQVSTPDWTK